MTETPSPETPAPRIVDSLEILAEVLHPGAFDFGHQGRGWARFTG